ncbi:MAG: ABC transporter permease, partial [Rhodanobacter sp.]
MSLHIKPILVALRRHKAGTVLIALQIALTLAIVCNALFIIHQRLANLSVRSGVDEAHVFVIANMWADVDRSTPEVDAQVRADLLALRQLPAVRDATPASGYPLKGGGWDNFVTMTHDQVQPTTDAAVYTGDEHFIDALGLRIVAGRNFRADEVVVMGAQQAITPPVVIVSKALADRLFPDGNALGKTFYAMGATPTTIVGIVDTLQRQGVDQWSQSHAGQSLIWPIRADDARGIFYIVRAKPGQLADAMRE